MFDAAPHCNGQLFTHFSLALCVRLFLSYFAGEAIEILEGGIDSGFNHVEPTTYQPRLLQVKGKGSQIRVTQVPLSHASLNSGDVFILDLGLKIHQWSVVSLWRQQR
jgi:hypothetical protein